MFLAKVIGAVVSTQKNVQFEGHKLLVVQPVGLEGQPVGTSMIAIDIVDAGEGDLVIVNKEGGAARILLENEKIPVQAVIVGVVDGMDVDGKAINP